MTGGLMNHIFALMSKVSAEDLMRKAVRNERNVDFLCGLAAGMWIGSMIEEHFGKKGGE